MKNATPSMTQIMFGLEEEDFVRVSLSRQIQQALETYVDIGLKPSIYTLGHKFYDTEKRAMFFANSTKTLGGVNYYIGRRILWMPTLDLIYEQATVDGILVSLTGIGDITRRRYHGIATDVSFASSNGSSTAAQFSVQPWVAVALPVAALYRRRLAEFGKASIQETFFTKDRNLARQPVQLTDQGEEAQQTQQT